MNDWDPVIVRAVVEKELLSGEDASRNYHVEIMDEPNVVVHPAEVPYVLVDVGHFRKISLILWCRCAVYCEFDFRLYKMGVVRSVRSHDYGSSILSNDEVGFEHSVRKVLTPIL